MRRLAASERWGHLGVMAAWLNEEDDWEADRDKEMGKSGGESLKKRKDADAETVESTAGEDGSRNKKNKMSASEEGQQVQRPLHVQ